ncbi:hypothetical protein HY502_01755 [Candidatus Woesebacteria bacterium]|nr:hypothetical protein [Candidatus Woesebacteria bacterium]
MIVTSVKLTGNPGPSGWAQVHEFTPEGAEKLSLRGKFFAVVGTSSAKEGIDSVSAGRELLARLHEEYFGKLEATAFNALKAAVENVTAEFSSSWGNVEIAAVCVLKNVVYSVSTGGAQTAIIREGAFAKILTSSEPKANGEISASSISGYPKEGDFLVFGTKKFFEVVGAEDIKSALSSKNLKSSAEALAPLIHSRNDVGSVGATILGFEGGTQASLAEDESVALDVKKEDAPVVIKSSQVFDKAKGFLKKLTDAFPERKIYVRGETDELTSAGGNRKVTLSVGALILILLIVSIGFGIRQKKNKDIRGKYEDRLVQAEHALSEAVTLLEINPERSRELFLEAKTYALEIKNEGVKDRRLEDLLEKLDSSQSLILGEYREEPELFIDLSLLTSGANGDDLAFSGGNLLVLDKASRRVVRIAVDTKKTETIAGPDQITSPQKVAGYEKKAFVVEDSGVFEVGIKKTSALEDTWDGEVLAHVFGANFYILEKGAGVIWRYPGDGSTFGAKQNWFGAGVAPNLSNAISMAIDGSIWVLNSDGRILKFAQGSPQAFSSQGMPLTGVDAIYTDEENTYVYILDKAGKRVVVFGKDGKYKAQYFSDKIGEAVDLAVSEKEGKIILLAGPKLYFLVIKHL